MGKLLISAIVTVNFLMIIALLCFLYPRGVIESPKDRIKAEDINIFKDHIIINISDYGLRWASIKNTDSMLPVIDEGHHSIEVMPKNKDDIYIGDIISFKHNEKWIIHRVVEIKKDLNGIYYLTKGDNNKINDGNKVRFENITGVVVGIIY